MLGSKSYEISILYGYKEETLAKDRDHKKKPKQYHQTHGKSCKKENVVNSAKFYWEIKYTLNKNLLVGEEGGYTGEKM